MSLRAIVLGSGKGVGLSVIRKLKANGYQVAAVSRNPDLEAAKDVGYHPIAFDLSDSQQLSKAFTEAEEKLGGFPGVVIYNAWAGTFPEDPDWVANIPLADINQAFQVNTVSLFAAAQLALAGWSKLGSSVPTTLIYTGNPLPWVNMPRFVSLGAGKSASALLIQSLATTYGGDGKRFYFTQQVAGPQGGLDSGIDGPIAAESYWDLIQRDSQGGWKVSFDKTGTSYEL